MLIINGAAFQFKAKDGIVEVNEIHEIYSNQEETDTRVITYMIYASSIEFRSIVIRSPDTDIFMLLLHHCSCFTSSVIYFDTGSGKHRRLVNITALLNHLAKIFVKVY